MILSGYAAIPVISATDSFCVQRAKGKTRRYASKKFSKNRSLKIVKMPVKEYDRHVFH